MYDNKNLLEYLLSCMQTHTHKRTYLVNVAKLQNLLLRKESSQIASSIGRSMSMVLVMVVVMVVVVATAMERLQHE
uniref:Uncharacterized protein n=1 Tax=Glossina palpalis gambiensis TaxID=67801 RepID=A0A1B0B0H8_9MUSC